MKPSLDSSVIVCTRNRSTFLAEPCKAIVAIDFPADRWEMIIIDNLSTDDTLEVARSIERENPEIVRVIKEPEIGLSAARNTGIREARGEIIAFIDDDAYPEPGWLRSLVEVLRQDDVLAAGGPIDPRFQGDGELPAWFGERYLPYLTVWDRGPEIHPLSYNEYPRGANIAFHREAFERFGLFCTDLGRKGKSLLSCEEIELCLRIERSGEKILYVPDAKISHLTVAERITPEWLADRFAAQGRSEAIVNWRHAGFPGLLAGLERYREHAWGANRHRHSEGGEIFAECQARALRGYFEALVSSPLMIPRYTPLPAAGTVADWLPFDQTPTVDFRKFEATPGRSAHSAVRAIDPDSEAFDPVDLTRRYDYEALVREEKEHYSGIELTEDLREGGVHAADSWQYYWQRVNGVLGKDFEPDLTSFLEHRFDQTSEPIQILSLGSGYCGHEIALSERLTRPHVMTCTDINEDIFVKAKKVAAEKGLPLKFEVVDLNFIEIEPRRYDMIFAHAVIHHVINLEQLFGRMAAGLAEGGILHLVEVVGKNRKLIWDENERFANALLELIPDAFTGGIRLDVATEEDGMEGIRQEDILPLLRQRFEPIYEYSHGAFMRFICTHAELGKRLDPKNPEAKAYLDFLMEVDESATRKGVLRPLEICGIYEPK